MTIHVFACLPEPAVRCFIVSGSFLHALQILSGILALASIGLSLKPCSCAAMISISMLSFSPALFCHWWALVILATSASCEWYVLWWCFFLPKKESPVNVLLFLLSMILTYSFISWFHLPNVFFKLVCFIFNGGSNANLASASFFALTVWSVDTWFTVETTLHGDQLLFFVISGQS